MDHTQNKIASAEFIGFFKREKIRLFLHDHNYFLIAIFINADIAERPGVLVNKKTALADLDFPQVIYATRQTAN
jgi:hypothetical protein